MNLKTEREQSTTAQSDLPRDLGDGLVLRLATPADEERYAQFCGTVFGVDHLDEQAVAWCHDFISPNHPAGGPGRILLVEDLSAGGKIVSTSCLIPQTWTYAGIPFGVGRPEMVATDPAYRRRGLVRLQLEYWHAQSAAVGHLVQAITGIPWYYRQFGYEYAIQLGATRVLYFSAIPALKSGAVEPYRLRPMTLEDVPFASRLYDRECARWMVACPRPEWLWRHLLTGYSPTSDENRQYKIVETPEGRAVGYVAATREIRNDALIVGELAVSEGVSLRAALAPVLRGLRPIAEAESAAQNKPLVGLSLSLGREHPAYDAMPELILTRRREYGWYIRVKDVPAYLRHIAPALQARLACSSIAGHTGEIKIGEYRAGYRIQLENGRLAAAESWVSEGRAADARFPPLAFLQLIFGFKALGELRDFYPDAWASDEADVLLNALFPKQDSVVIPVG